MLNRTTIALLAGSALAFHAATSSAAVIVSYDFAGGSPSQSGGVATGSDMTIGAFTGGDNTPVGAGFSGSSNSIFVRTQLTGATTSEGDDLSDAIANDAFVSFTVTNSTGGDLDLGTLSFNYWVTSPATTIAYRTYVLADVSGFVDGNELGVGELTAGSVPNNAGDQELQVIDISSLGTLADGNAIEFRLYVTDTSTSQSRIHRIDDVTIEEVPEPGSLALLVLGGLCMARRRRD